MLKDLTKTDWLNILGVPESRIPAVLIVRGKRECGPEAVEGVEDLEPFDPYLIGQRYRLRLENQLIELIECGLHFRPIDVVVHGAVVPGRP